MAAHRDRCTTRSPSLIASVDNTTIWTNNFDRQHYLDTLFSETPGAPFSMREFYIENSSGQYAVNGDVTDWTNVPFNEAAYGSNYCGSIVCVRDIQRLLEDGLNQWYADQLAAGKTAAQIDAYLSQFDKWDRYDYDGDGNFTEPDGYIDHFQTVHAGVGEETGGGAQGTDAIWSHRSTIVAGAGSQGPPFNRSGGVHIGGSSYWVGDYTIEPENGGSGVFSHEFGHDLGLPDEYDTSGNTGGAENGTGWWTIMSQGSYGTDGTEDLGTRPVHFNAWDKFQLGWLNYAVASAGKRSSVRLGPAETNTKQAQGMFVILPKKQVTTNLGAPYAGSKFYYSGTGDDLDTTMTRSFTLPAGTVSFAAKVRYNIEVDWDYAYLTVNGTPVHTNLSTNTSPNGQNFGEGITGVKTSWVDLTADLSAYAGQTVTLGFRYWTDGAQQGTPGESSTPGFQVDEIAVTGSPTDGAETDTGWAYSPATGGFRVTTGTESQSFNNYYVAEYRQYRGFDDSLRTGPYNFGFLDNPLLQNWVEHFPYQDGLLVHYWNTSYSDNNVGDHPGAGLILPVDSHPAALHFADGSVMRPRLQSFDATFGLEPTDAITLHKNSVPTTVPSRPGVSIFDDLQTWWVASDPGDAPGGGRYQIAWNSVNVPKTGTSIRVVGTSTQGSFMDVLVQPSK